MKSGVIIAPPGCGKTTIEAKLIEHWMTVDPGPVIVISRVKSLVGQVLGNLVMLNKYHPDRIACYSDSDHEMDLKDPIAVGTIGNKDVEDCIRKSFHNKDNVIIGAVANHGSVSLLKWCLKNNLHVKVIVDELAEIIPGADGTLLEETQPNKNTTLDVLYNLKAEGLLDYVFGFDAVWKTGNYRGMNDAEFWGHSEPIILHKQREMTYEKNVLCPVELIAVEINNEDLISLGNSNDEDSKERRIEVAANIKAMQHQLSLMHNGEQPVAKALCFSSGSDNAKFNKSELGRYFGSQLEVNEFVLAATSRDYRGAIQKKIADPMTKVGVISNYDIWTKGMDIQDLSAVMLGWKRLPNPEKLTHIIGRATRRNSRERGLPIEQCKIKTVGRFYVPYLLSEADGGSDYTQVLKVWETLYDQGFTDVRQSLLRGSSTKNNNTVNKMTVVLEKIFENVDDSDIARVNIGKALKAAEESKATMAINIANAHFSTLFSARTEEEAFASLRNFGK